MNEPLKQLQDILAGLTTEELEQVRQWCKALLVQRRAAESEEPPQEPMPPPSVLQLWDTDQMSTALYLALKKKDIESLPDLCRYTETEILSIRELTADSRRELFALMDQFSLSFRKE